jgi:peptide methionine sulfoxide reductase MsrB
MSLENTLEYRRELMIGSATATVNRYGYEIPYETMVKIIGTELDWEIEEEDVIYDAGSPYMDTMVREAVFDCVAKYYVGRTWPTYGERVDMDDFKEKLLKSIEEKK